MTNKYNIEAETKLECVDFRTHYFIPTMSTFNPGGYTITFTKTIWDRLKLIPSLLSGRCAIIKFIPFTDIYKEDTNG